MSDHQIEAVNHLKKKLEKGVSFEKTMHILYKLQKIPISIKLLEETGIGFKVRELSKQQKNNDIGKTAKLLTITWKDYVRNHQRHSESEQDLESNHSDTSPRYSGHNDEQQYNDESVNSDNYVETPKSEHSEECFSPSGVNQTSSHKKKHKKKKKKASKEDNDSDEEEYGEHRSKDKKKSKKRHRDNKNDDYHRHHKSYKNMNTTERDEHDNSVLKKAKLKMDSPSVSNNQKTGTYDEDIFGALLEMGDQRISKGSVTRKPTNSVISKPKIHQQTNGNAKIHEMPQSSKESQPDRFDILSSLPDPNYQPPPISRRNEYIFQDPGSMRNSKPSNDKNVILAGMKFTKGRTQVFAGSSKTATVPQVYRLQDLCIRLLINNIDKIYEVGDLSYYILKPVLSKCTIQQLKRIEYYNPSLLEDSDELWKDFCDRDFKVHSLAKTKFKTWRDYYHHLTQAREEKLKNITRNISTKQRKAVPERKTQQIDLKTPREIRRRQEKSIAFPLSSRSNPMSSGSRSLGGNSGQVTIVNTKPKTAPLMKKLLQMRQSKFRR